MKRITLALTGASGMAYGLRLLDCLLAAACRVDLLVSQAARIVAKQELGLTLPSGSEELARCLNERSPGHRGELRVYGREEWFAPAASGSNPADAMVVCPCTMGTLAAIAQGLADNLIERAADVMLKERRPLVLVPRETPFSLIHLRNMTALAEAGATVLPANPGFYHRPRSVDEVVDEAHLSPPWLLKGIERFAREREQRLARIRAIDVTEPVAEGDLVFSASLAGVVDEPLLYGRVVRVERPAEASSWEIWMEPAVPAAGPSEVLVLCTEVNPLRLADRQTSSRP